MECVRLLHGEKPHLLTLAQTTGVGPPISAAWANTQIRKLARRKARCGRISSDEMSRSRMEQPPRGRLLAYRRAGDALVFSERSRITRPWHNLVETASSRRNAERKQHERDEL